MGRVIAEECGEMFAQYVGETENHYFVDFLRYSKGLILYIVTPPTSAVEPNFNLHQFWFTILVYASSVVIVWLILVVVFIVLDKVHFHLKKVDSLIFHKDICYGTHWKSLEEILLMSTHNRNKTNLNSGYSLSRDEIFDLEHEKL